MRRQITDPTDPRLALLQPRPGQTVWEGWEPDQVIVSTPCTCGSGFVDRRVHARCGGSGRVSERVTL